MTKIILIFFFCIFLINSCADKNDKEIISLPASIDNLETEMIAVYEEAMKSLKDGDNIYAANKFIEAENLFPQSTWAPQASLMASYAFYTMNLYSDSIFHLKRFIKIYPRNKNTPYAHYLMAICYFEQILDEKKDLKPLLLSKEKFEFILSNFSETDYAIDSKYKLDLIMDQLAAKEMYVGRHYMKVRKWIPAINRFKIVVKNYDKTVYIEEALHRLVEIHYTIGLIDEAKKYAILLGYNYQSSQWYKNTYKVFNKSYKFEKIKKKKKEDGLIKRKIKSLFE